MTQIMLDRDLLLFGGVTWPGAAIARRQIANLNGFYRGYDPSAWAQMQLTGVNVPVRIGRTTVLPRISWS